MHEQLLRCSSTKVSKAKGTKPWFLVTPILWRGHCKHLTRGSLTRLASGSPGRSSLVACQSPASAARADLGQCLHTSTLKSRKPMLGRRTPSLPGMNPTTSYNPAVKHLNRASTKVSWAGNQAIPQKCILRIPGLPDPDFTNSP